MSKLKDFMSLSNVARHGLQIKMSSVYEIPPQEFNLKLAQALKEIPEFQMPEWAYFVKTSTSKERPPESSDYWHKRAASILKQIYIQEIVGVGRLRTKYGSRKDRGMKPEKFYKAGGKIIRTILQQAEKAGFVEKAELNKKKGRKLTKSGKELLDSIK